ncbi:MULTISPECIES: hypothetical protein [Herbaspirillum]|uniref:Uncharacterized protein n=1 Tax=Herbaspirillum frisingense TaxID=92645 RepID=A0ABU1PBC6_9BURK|nr:MULTISPECIES: hypothetical protein [Herbaspirillum]MDR6583227.1 hypothetical protein [Herbaspirillum frisingense]
MGFPCVNGLAMVLNNAGACQWDGCLHDIIGQEALSKKYGAAKTFSKKN